MVFNSGSLNGKGPGGVPGPAARSFSQDRRALIEFMKELKGIVGEKPVTDEELQGAKDSLIQGCHKRFGSVSAIATSISLNGASRRRTEAKRCGNP